MKRCSWVNVSDKKYVFYHDKEWGIPVYDDRLLFEMLILETFQAGLSWQTILQKRDNFKKVVVCGSGKTDIKMIEMADFSVCLSTAPDYIKEKVDLVLGENKGEVLKVFEKIYHGKDFNKIIKKIKKGNKEERKL